MTSEPCGACGRANWGSIYDCDNCGFIGDCCLVNEESCRKCGEIIDIMEEAMGGQ